MAPKKNIVIIGYPKSGNTWATRLVAEMVGCPVGGFWNSDQDEIAVEGLDRVSDYVCHKSHHQWKELSEQAVKPDKMIYIVRDPRDICISGAHYFNRTAPIPSATRNVFVRFLNKAHWLVFGRKKMIAEMIKAVLEGNAWIHRWCSVSWFNHYVPFANRDDVLVIRYADLLQEGPPAARKILKFIGVDRSDAEIQAALEAHSFVKTRKRFESSGEREKVQFLRKGSRGEWRSLLTQAQKKQFNEMLGDQLENLGFDRD